MELKQEVDIRDEIMNHLKLIERDLGWLSKKIAVPYATLYSIFVQKNFKLSEDKKSSINEVLETSF